MDPIRPWVRATIRGMSNARSRGSGQVYRQKYRDAEGQLREVSTWSASYWDRTRRKKVRRHGFATSKEAWRWLRAVFGRLEAGQPVVGDAVDKRLSDAFDLVEMAYRLKGRRSSRVIPRFRRYVIESLGDMRLVDVEEGHVERHAARLLDRGLSPASVNRTLSMLRHAFALAARRWRGTFFPPHIQMLREDNIRREFASLEEVDRLCAALPRVEAAFVRTVSVTGWRPWREVATRTWDDVDFADGLIYLHRGQGKTDVAKACPLEPDLLPVLQDMWALSQEVFARRGVRPRYVFPSSTGERMRSFHRSAAWRQALQTAGSPPGRILYDLCKTAARSLIRAGVPEHQAQTWTGKKTPSVFRRYDVVDTTDLRANAKKLSAFRDAERAKAAAAAAAKETVH